MSMEPKLGLAGNILCQGISTLFPQTAGYDRPEDLSTRHSLLKWSCHGNGGEFIIARATLTRNNS